MSVILSVRKMESLLSIPTDKRNMRWAHDVCTASRFVHIDVWRFCPDPEYVKNTVIPLVSKASSALSEMRDRVSSDRNKLKISQYAQNDGARVKNLEENYLKGKSSTFVPDDMLSEPTATDG